MTAETPDGRSGGVINSAYGKFSGAGEAAIITLGFVPNYVKVINETDAIVWEVINGMTATKVAKTAAAVTIETNSDIVINTDGTVTLSSTLAANAKVLAWYASV